MSTREKFFYGLLVIPIMVTLVLITLTGAALAQKAMRKDWPKKIVICATGGETGPGYPIMAGIGRMIEKYLDVPVNVIGTAGHEASVLLSKGEAHIAMPSTYSAIELLRGKTIIKGLRPLPFRAWLQAQIFSVDYLVLEKSGIKSFRDLSGKTICIGPRAVPIPDIVLNALSKIYGFDLKSVKVVKWDRPTEAFDGLKSGKFDCIQIQGAWPLASVTELFLSHPAHYLTIDDASMANLRKQFPWIVGEVIPRGTYKGMDKDVQVAALPMFVGSLRDLPDSLVYAMTKMVWEHFDEFSSFHPACKKFRAADVTKIVDSCPYHNGAIKYYREIGVWTKELDQRQAATLASIPPSVR